MLRCPEFEKNKGKINEIRLAKKAENPGAFAMGASKGGKIKAQRRKFKDMLLEILDRKTTAMVNGKTIELTVQEKLCLDVLKDSNKTKAFEIVRDTIGEKPIDKIEFKSDITPDKAKEFADKILKNDKRG